MTALSATAMSRRRGRSLVPLWLVLGGLGWAGLAWIATRLAAVDPRTAGFDLELVLRAGRELAAGRSPYEPAMLQGIAPAAPSLFFSYPPLVAQAAIPLAPLSTPIVLAVLWLCAATGIAAVTLLLGRLRPELEPLGAVVPILALAPLCLVFGTGLLFGNLDVLFPLTYGLLLAAALFPSRGHRAAGGVALALTTLTKLHPGSMGVWFLVRGARERLQGRTPGSWMVVGAALVAAAVALSLSLLAGGLDLWGQYVTVIRAGSGASVVDVRNAGPAAQMALLLGQTDATARLLQLPVTALALVITGWAAWALPDPVESLAWAAAASLVILPVTWYHYPAALMPFAIAAALRAHGTERWRPTIRLLAGALVVSGVAIAWLPLLWLAVALVILAARQSAATATWSPAAAATPA